jgi:hypothetical protein
MVPGTFPSDPPTHAPDIALTPSTMSEAHTTALASNFQLIFNSALKTYEKRTKKDLLAHPLAAQLQDCDSPSAILAVLQLQVQVFDQSQSRNDRWIRWLDPTVNVLYAFSETIGEGVSLVSLSNELIKDLSDIYLAGIFTRESDICWSRDPPFSTHLFRYLACGYLISTFLRQPRMFAQAKTPLWTFSSGSKAFSDVSKSTSRYPRLRK